MLAKFWTNASGLLFSWRDNSSFRCYTLGPLCLWQCFKECLTAFVLEKMFTLQLGKYWGWLVGLRSPWMLWKVNINRDVFGHECLGWPVIVFDSVKSSRRSLNKNVQILSLWSVQPRRLGCASGLVVLPVQLRGIPYCELHLSRGEGEVLLGEICRGRSTLPLESSQVSPNIEI